ncbi:methionyl-tRNA formyltransferase [Megamonas hypermegale]|uniref:methionyl-tRNA formyltransferase n=1 Tax=Megamonas hypermegale TaxID=158847 RepID=UPI000B383619|nr:methionyl-tRNA formyltransferase [Megamonas hypermegale]MBM6760569.1 methionyl-tRNA formyltransferase [Megamonas hypermegale]OUO38249.1 methionyl-tRNA formyltransferase [Megamonas hypermegale]
MQINNIIFMGTPDFAVPCLDKLHQNYNVTAVITQPDRPKGRGQHLAKSPVKVYAEEHNLPVYQPEKIKTAEFTEKLRQMQPDLIIVVAFGQILSQEILDIPKFGCINVHASLLPRWRGAAPIHWSIIGGDTETGVTTMYMDAGLDTGDMILKAKTVITPEMTTAQLHDALMMQGADLLIETIQSIENGTVSREKQDDSLSCYAKMLNNDNCRIDWKKSAQEVHNLVRGLNSWPIAYTTLNGKKFKIWQTKIVDADTTGKTPGQIIDLTKKGIIVATGNGAIELLQIQPPNKAKMPASSYINGHRQELSSDVSFI